MPQNSQYDFLNDYIDKVINQSPKADEQPLEDDNDFYQTTSDDEDQDEPNDGITYNLLQDGDVGFEQANAYLRSTGDPIDDQGNPLDDQEGAGGMTPDEEDPNSIYGTGSTGSFYDEIPHGEPHRFVNSLEGDLESPKLGDKISAKESQGKYTAYNPAGGGSGAVGKYQFRWNIWQDSIKQVTGVKTQQQFLHSPAAQEKYFSWYKKNYLLPEAQKLQPYNKKGLTADQLAELVHFRGTAGAKKYLQGQVPDKPEAYNSSISDYLGIPGSRQTGGQVYMDSVLQANKSVPFVDRLLNPSKYPVRQNADGTVSTMLMGSASDDKGPFAYPSLRLVNGKWVETKGSAGSRAAAKAGDIIRFKTDEEAEAFANNGYKQSKAFKQGKYSMGGVAVASTPSAQYHGLNNGSFSQMVFPMEGENTFRGLDDGTPVYLEDETGKKKVLKGRKHTTKMKGRVYETRLNG